MITDITDKRVEQLMYELKTDPLLENSFINSSKTNDFDSFKKQLDEKYIYNSDQINFIEKVFKDSFVFSSHGQVTT